MKSHANGSGGHSLLTKLLIGGGFLAVVVVLMIWLAGGFHRKIGDATRHEALAVSGTALPPGAVTAIVRSTAVPRTETAVGTVRAVRESSVASKLLAKVVEVDITAGQHVKEGEVLVRLESADLEARSEQAAAAVRAATAVRDQAKIEFDRIEDRLMGLVPHEFKALLLAKPLPTLEA